MMQPLHILVVDDHPVMEMLFSQKFREYIRNGTWRLLFAQNGREAMRQLETCPDIAVVVSDLLMPNMGGLALLTHLNAHYPFVRSIVMTAYPEMSNIRAVMNRGAFDFLQKPLDLDDLEITLNNAIADYKQIVQEMTERRKAEEALQLSERQYRELAGSVDVGIAIVQQRRLVLLNEALCTLFDKSDEYLLQQTPESLLETTDHEQNAPSSFSSEGQPSIRHIAVAGREKWLETTQKPIQWEKKPAILLTVRDITEHRQLELTLTQKEKQLEQENVTLRSGLKDRYRFGDIIGKSEAMQMIYEQILQAASSHEPVLISGESGTGKELIAQTIHHQSSRAKHKSVPVNCGAVPQHLFEREFFGHRKGAFTDATRDHPGFFDAACQGTLFLDEVAEFPPAQQVKLLRALADGEYTPVGSHTPQKARVRIIAATNRNLWKLLETGQLREDFFYRIHVISIKVPPLRERKEDIPLLVEHFLEQLDHPNAREPLPPDLLTHLYNYDWPGNVRELQNVLCRYVATHRLIFMDSQMAAPVEVDLTAATDGKQTTQSLREAVKEFEKHYLLSILKRHQWHKTKTAAALGIRDRTLRRKIREYQIEPQ